MGGQQVQAITCFMLAQALEDGTASTNTMLLADLAGESEGAKASAFGLQVGAVILLISTFC